LIGHCGFGIDFGTTNSSLAVARPNGDVELTRFRTETADTESFRSLLYLEKQEGPGRHRTQVWTGPTAIDAYLQADPKGRLIQSLKSFLTSRNLKSTDIFGRQYTLEDLIGRIIRGIREKAEEQLHTRIRSVVAGRPVWFVGAETEADNQFALGRLEAAFKLAGFEEIRFEYEPIGAAYHYESTLDHEELILIGDFGGGTSDFSLLRVGGRNGHSQQDLLGNAGLGLAGDSFDARIIRHVVSPALGAGTEMQTLGKTLPVPQWIYNRLERWHHVSFLKTRDVLNMLQSVKAQAFEPGKIEALVHLITEDLGYQLHQAVQSVKVQLSSKDHAYFQFRDSVVDVEAEVRRQDFEMWIEDELERIQRCVDDLLAKTAIDPKAVDRVFLTGGTSFVPSVRRIFESRFGAKKIRSGHEFTSVARGLALRAFETGRKN
jgi:hypothetical chaperone protein